LPVTTAVGSFRRPLLRIPLGARRILSACSLMRRGHRKGRTGRDEPSGLTWVHGSWRVVRHERRARAVYVFVGYNSAMTLACGSHGLEAGMALLMITIGAAFYLRLRCVARCRAVADSRAPMERAFAEMDALDAREALEGEYRDAIAVLSTHLPSWAAALAIERIADRESPSRRRYLKLLKDADIVEERERLVEIAKDSTDPLAADAWSLLTGRPAGEWAKALVASDGGQDERAFLGRKREA